MSGPARSGPRAGRQAVRGARRAAGDGQKKPRRHAGSQFSRRGITDPVGGRPLKSRAPARSLERPAWAQAIKWRCRRYRTGKLRGRACTGRSRGDAAQVQSDHFGNHPTRRARPPYRLLPAPGRCGQGDRVRHQRSFGALHLHVVSRRNPPGFPCVALRASADGFPARLMEMWALPSPSPSFISDPRNASGRPFFHGPPQHAAPALAQPALTPPDRRGPRPAGNRSRRCRWPPGCAAGRRGGRSAARPSPGSGKSVRARG